MLVLAAMFGAPQARSAHLVGLNLIRQQRTIRKVFTIMAVVRPGALSRQDLPGGAWCKCLGTGKLAPGRFCKLRIRLSGGVHRKAAAGPPAAPPEYQLI